jgi:hypothetical protein
MTLVAFTLFVFLLSVPQSAIAGKIQLPIDDGLYVAKDTECPKVKIESILYDIPEECIYYSSERNLFKFGDDMDHDFLLDSISNKGDVYSVKGTAMSLAGSNPDVYPYELTLAIVDKASFSITKSKCQVKNDKGFSDFIKGLSSTKIYRFCGK